MNILLTLVLIVHVMAAIGIVILVLLQHGKGADVGAAFGSGASGSLFGATGSANFLSRFTAALAAVFFCTSLGLAYLAASKPKASGTIMDSVPAPSSVPGGTIPSPSGATGMPPGPSGAPPGVPGSPPAAGAPAGAGSIPAPKSNEVPK